MKPVSQQTPTFFDMLNCIQNMTGPGRPGREQQASLTALAAAGLAWDYPTLLSGILKSSSLLQDLRDVGLSPVVRA